MGWLYRDSSGNVQEYAFGNLQENDTHNRISRNDSGDITLNDTSFGTDLDNTQVEYYSSGGMVHITSLINQVKGTGDGEPVYVINLNGSTIDEAVFGGGFLSDATSEYSATTTYGKILGQGTHTIKIQGKLNGGTDITIDNFTTVISED